MCSYRRLSLHFGGLIPSLGIASSGLCACRAQPSQGTWSNTQCVSTAERLRGLLSCTVHFARSMCDQPDGRDSPRNGKRLFCSVTIMIFFFLFTPLPLFRKKAGSSGNDPPCDVAKGSNVISIPLQTCRWGFRLKRKLIGR